jgi:hypothetical protein
MALPTLERTWQFDVNNGPYTSNAAALFALKDILVSFSSSPWTVVRSCDSLSVSTSDLWVDSGDVVFGGTGEARSWIVLKQTGIASNFQICIECREAGGGQDTVVQMFASENAGFTGGSTTGRATATEERACQRSGDPEWWNGSASSAKLHVMQSQDGKSTRWWYYESNVCLSHVAIEVPSDTPSGWTIPWVVLSTSHYYSATNYFPQYTNLNDDDEDIKGRAGGVSAKFFLTCEGYGSAMIGQNQTYGNDLDSSSYPILPVGVYSATTGARGRQGRLVDYFFGSTAVNDGDHYPSDGSRQLVQIYDTVQPWGGNPAMQRS